MATNESAVAKPKLLIVDDVEDIRTQMKWGFAKDYEVFEAEDRESAFGLFQEHHMPLVTLDLGLPPEANGVGEGFRLLEQMIQEHPRVKVVVITGQGDRQHAISAISQGAYDFFSKPIKLDELAVVLSRARRVFELEKENDDLQRKLKGDSFEGMLGFSPKMQVVFQSVRRVATSDAPVLITGESGTGKELVAQAIHQLSERVDGPFVAINCGAIPENLLESELFGHEKGAFTGAHARRAGRIELANGGTLLLDEIGELPLTLQVKLLRFLQEHQIERVGGRQTISVDVRVLAATNTDLKEAMEGDSFREDLYYRLAVVNLALPALRERGEDVLVLARSFVQRFSGESKKNITGFSEDAEQAIEGHRWPGNVRELENRVRRAVIMSEGRRITAEDLELSTAGVMFKSVSLKEAREKLERELIQRSLSRYAGNITKAAADLKISRPTLYELMDKLEIKREGRTS